jgi:Holliday junction DNA helicase RuvA
MIGYLEGRAVSARIVVCAGVGYTVMTPEPLRVGEEVHLWVSTQVREDSITLFAFRTEQELTVYEALVKLPGVGAQTALALLRDVGVRGVVAKDASVLKRASGVGAKLASRIAAELVIPAGLDDVAVDEESGAVFEVTQTLCALGFPQAQSRQAAERAVGENPDGTDEELIAAGLRIVKEDA